MPSTAPRSRWPPTSPRAWPTSIAAPTPSGGRSMPISTRPDSTRRPTSHPLTPGSVAPTPPIPRRPSTCAPPGSPRWSGRPATGGTSRGCGCRCSMPRAPRTTSPDRSPCAGLYFAGMSAVDPLSTSIGRVGAEAERIAAAIAARVPARRDAGAPSSARGWPVFLSRRGDDSPAPTRGVGKPGERTRAAQGGRLSLLAFPEGRCDAGQKRGAESPEGNLAANAGRPPPTVRKEVPSGNAPGTHDHATDHIPDRTAGRAQDPPAHARQRNARQEGTARPATRRPPRAPPPTRCRTHRPRPEPMPPARPTPANTPPDTDPTGTRRARHRDRWRPPPPTPTATGPRTPRGRPSAAPRPRTPRQRPRPPPTTRPAPARPRRPRAAHPGPDRRRQRRPPHQQPARTRPPQSDQTREPTPRPATPNPTRPTADPQTQPRQTRQPPPGDHRPQRPRPGERPPTVFFTAGRDPQGKG